MRFDMKRRLRFPLRRLGTYTKVLEHPQQNAQCRSDHKALVTTHEQIVYRLLPQKVSNWRWLEGTLEDRRLPDPAILGKRIDCYRKIGKSLQNFGQCKALTKCRHDLPEMAAFPVAILRVTLKQFDFADRSFIRRVGSGKTPGVTRFRGRRYFDSIASFPA